MWRWLTILSSPHELLERHRLLTRLLLKRAWARRQHVELPDEVEVQIAELGASPQPEALARLTASWRLTPCERDTWATLASLTCEPELGLLAGELHAGFGTPSLTTWLTGWLLEPLHPAHEVLRALAPTGRLVATGLVDLHEDAKPFLQRRVTVAPEVLWELEGRWDGLPEELAACAWELDAPALLAPVQPLVADTARAALGDARREVTLVLEGEPGVGRKGVVAAWAGRPVLAVDLGRLAPGPGVLARAVRVAARTALLRGRQLYLDTTPAAATTKGADDVAPARATRPTEIEQGELVTILERLPAPVVIGVAHDDEQRWTHLREVARARVSTADLEAQVGAWQALGEDAGLDAAGAARLARRFPLRLAGIREVNRRVTERARGGTERDLPHFEREARERLRQEVGRIARPASTELDWGDLVLPDDLLSELQELAVYVSHRETVMNRYGMRKWGGTGLHILFSGEPGTGKSTAAAVLGKALEREVLQVNLDQIFSKYVGETEKQLVSVFELAERSRALLLLDEADALLAKRTDVSSANDRFGNISVNVVLQLMEQHEVVSVATTNREAGMDDAGLRRFAFRFKFPSPDVAMRARLFRGMLPKHVEVDPEIDWQWLAEKVDVTGGYVRNIMQRAAALAAARDGVLSLATMVAAVNRELKQLGALPLRY